ncbi:MAG: TetR/AcrR family transcriptional regulator [Chitinophagaceae bacterium]
MKKEKELDLSTEEKIKNAARIVFHQKGFSGTRTRDIAEEAGINLALLNYYFRSKENLFDLIMLEAMQDFLNAITSVCNDATTSLETKIETIVANYIDTLTERPDIPLFVLNELKRNPEKLSEKLGINKIFFGSVFMEQILERILKSKNRNPIHPLHFIINLLSLTVFPFIAKPMIKGLAYLPDEEFNELMQERKTLIPIWIDALLKTI